MEGKTRRILLAKTLAKILYKTLLRVIGLRSFIHSAFFFFGIITKLVLFSSPRKYFLRNHSFQYLNTFCSMLCQKLWKNAGYRPSGPDALSGCIYLMAKVNSSRENSSVNFILYYVVMVLCPIETEPSIL